MSKKNIPLTEGFVFKGGKNKPDPNNPPRPSPPPAMKPPKKPGK